MKLKKSVLLALALWAAAFTLPLLVYSGGPAGATETPPGGGPDTQNTLPPTGTQAEDTPGELIKIPVHIDGSVVEYDLEDAVAAIVAAEMPALFPEQALRAQAVAARTYIMHKAQLPPNSKHPDALICDDSSHCVAMADFSVLEASWGAKAPEYIARIKNAVLATAGEILFYDSKPIVAVFHSMSGPRTNSAADIWGSAVPYLVSVEAPAGESELDGYRESSVVERADFKKAFAERYPAAVLPDNSLSWFADFVRSSSGAVLTVKVGGVEVKGSDIRSLCGLRSANFEVTEGSAKLLFETVGYGHGVGMSQNGAKVMALAGSDYREILAKYYPGAVPGRTGE